MVRANAWVHALEEREAPECETRSREQNHRQRELGDYEDAACELRPGRSSVAVPERASGRRASELPGRNEAEEQPGEQRCDERKQEDPPVERDLLRARQVGRDLRREHELEERLAGHESGDAAEQRDHEAFREQLASDSSRTGAERTANRELALARARAGEQEIAQVRARDQKNKCDRAHQDPKPLARGADDRVAQRSDVDASSLVVLRPIASESLRLEPHLGARLLDGRAGGESADRRDEVLVPVRAELRVEP